MQHSRFYVLRELAEFSPADLAARARTLPGLVFFDSARQTCTGADISLLAVCPQEMLAGNLFEASDFTLLQSAVLRLESLAAGVDDGLPGPVIAGAVEYDGKFLFGIYSQVLVYRHSEAQWYGNGDWWRSLLTSEVVAAKVAGPIEFVPQMECEGFCGMVERAQEYIGAGDIYQVNVSYPFRAEWPGGDPWAYYEALRHYSPAPYGAFLQLGSSTILSTSPELFLQISGRLIRTRPIKGTRPRRADPHADERSAFDLITSPKEVAELVMITDLERSDLGQICEWGSVSVRELLKLERHEQVFHLVSTVEGRLRPEVDAVSALRACFPGGSITGAPKRRAREVIKELEAGGRGLYTGAVGWFGAAGESVFNIAIRTVVLEAGQLSFSVGAGVVADSVAEREWQETWDKAAGILLAADRVGRVESGKVDRTLPEALGSANSRITSL
jgi:para-aminobenzoate synthetase component 1